MSDSDPSGHTLASLLGVVAVAVNETSDENEAIATAIREVCVGLGWPVGHAFLTDGDEFVPTDLWHLDEPGKYAEFRESTHETRFRSGTGLVGRAGEGRPVWIPDVREDPDFVRRGPGLGIRSGYAFPILVGDEVAGVLEFFSDHVEEPGEELLESMVRVGTQVGRVIERARAERTIQASEAKYQGIVSLAADAIVSIDEEYRIVLYNRAAERIFGWKSEEILGKPIDILVPEAHREAHRGHLGRFSKNPARFGCHMGQRLEVSGLRKSDEVFPAEGSISKLDLEDGEIYTAILRDVSESKKAAEALKASESRFRRLVETMNEGVWLHAPDGTTTWVNRRMAEMLGYEPKELIGRSVFDFMDEDVKEQAREKIHRRASMVSEQYELRLRRKDGETLWVLLNSSPLTDEKGEFQEGLVVITNITQRIKAEEEIRVMNIELEKRVKKRTAELAVTNAELESFAYSVSHDLRAPLRIIDGYSLALVEDFEAALGEEGGRYLERIRHNVQGMGDLIDDLLTLSRITRSVLRREPVDLSVMAREVVEGLRHTAPEREVETVIPNAMTVVADLRLTRIALENLLGNAWKFTSGNPRARIEFGAFKDGEERIFFVQDDGAGFDPRYADKLFVPFQRLHTSTEFEGNGIGLATVRRIVSRHDGRVWGEGESGRGATFYFSLEGLEDS